MAYMESIYDDIDMVEDWEPEDIEEDDWGGEDWEPEDIEDYNTERRRRRRYKRRSRGAIRRHAPRAKGSTGARVHTAGGGSARIQFQKPLATQESVNKSIKALSDHVVKVEKTVDKNTSVLDAKVNAVRNDIKKSQQSMQMMMMLPMLMQKDPKPKDFTLKDTTDATATAKKYEVTDPHYQSQDNTLMLLLPMMMSGGMGGNDSMAMMMMALALSGSFGKSS